MASSGLTFKADMANAWKSIREEAANRLLSFAVIAVAPAILWPLAILGISHLIGWSVSIATLIIFGSAIFVFLSFICAGMIASGTDNQIPSCDVNSENGPAQNSPKKKDRRAA